MTVDNVRELMYRITEEKLEGRRVLNERENSIDGKENGHTKMVRKRVGKRKK